MFYKDSHLSDQELLLSVDGELSGHRQKQAVRHLQSCWTCRKRMAEVESTIAGVVDCYHSLLEAETPPGNGSEAFLRTRLAAEALPPSAQQQRWPWFAFAAGVLLIAVATGLFLKSQRNRITPIPSLTPGETLGVSKNEICQGNTKGDNQEVPNDLRQAVFTEYGLKNVSQSDYEVDFLITPALGGSASIRNLWPEPYGNLSWNAHTKDILERRLHTMVCRGEIDLSTAQREIAANWVEAYKKYVKGASPM